MKTSSHVKPEDITACVPAKRVSLRFKNAGATGQEARTLLADLKADGDILIRGSMNLNQNRKLEQFDASMSFELCEWFETVMEQMWSLGAPPKHGLAHSDLIDNIERLQ